MHAALLLSALKQRDPSLAFTGMGGMAVADAGCHVRHGMELVSLVGLGGILRGLPGILALLRRIKHDLKRLRPKAVILVDCPEFNFRVAKIAHKLGIPVYYYISPQIWAWRSGRVNFLKKYVREVLCILPFEKNFYEQRGMRAQYVGHPLMDRLPLAELDALPVDPDSVGILPGSRRREIATLLPVFAEAVRRMSREHPIRHVRLVRAPGADESLLRSLWPDDLPCEMVEPEARYAAMRRSRVLLAASGTVTLEAALIGTPGLLAYKLSPFEFKLTNWLVNVEFAGLPNLIHKREVFPELIQEKAEPEGMARTALELLLDGPKRHAALADLAALRTMVGKPGAPQRASDIILNDLRTLATEPPHA